MQKEALYQKYKVEQASTANVKGYEEAMWIISNTYPMITIENMLSKVGGLTLEGIKDDIKTIDDAISEATLEMKNKKEDYK